MINWHCLIEALKGTSIVIGMTIVVMGLVRGLAALVEAGRERLATTIGIMLLFIVITAVFYFNCMEGIK